MFTGIVEAEGIVVGCRPPRLEVACNLRNLSEGESVSVNGVCLTVAAITGSGFAADLSEETLRRSALHGLGEGDRVNLERAMPASGRFGGHVVQGHVDGVGRVLKRVELDGSVEMTFSIPESLERYLVEKGSVAVDGVSLTVTDVGPGWFSVSLIPHTLVSTRLGDRRPGDPVNIEVDVLAKYVERLLTSSGR
ncbi:MAG: riboflavin synthase [Actinomycetota bacterium]|nr:riboflavin synthase [Actinomycetota bacterium]